jgi:hypothetical protein
VRSGIDRRRTGGWPLVRQWAIGSRWNDTQLHPLNGVHGSDFEVVDTSNLINGP